jgi:hypothetical protein
VRKLAYESRCHPETFIKYRDLAVSLGMFSVEHRPHHKCRLTQHRQHLQKDGRIKPVDNWLRFWLWWRPSILRLHLLASLAPSAPDGTRKDVDFIKKGHGPAELFWEVEAPLAAAGTPRLRGLEPPLPCGFGGRRRRDS